MLLQRYWRRMSSLASCRLAWCTFNLQDPQIYKSSHCQDTWTAQGYSHVQLQFFRINVSEMHDIWGFNVRFSSAWFGHLEYTVVMSLEARFCLRILPHCGWDAECPSASQACWCASETATWQVELEPLEQLATGSTLSLAVDQDMNHDFAHLLRPACLTYVSQLIQPK
jgi:hypothetical protein